MTIGKALAGSFNVMHALVNATIGDLDEDVAYRELPGANIAVIGPIMAHLLIAEDYQVNVLARGGTAILEMDDWMARIGAPAGMPMLTPEFAQRRFSVAGLREYGAAVFAETERWAADASDAALMRTMTLPTGVDAPLAAFLGGLTIAHSSAHAGEVAALKGVHGLKGLPF